MNCETNAAIVRKWFKKAGWKYSENTRDGGVIVFRTSVSADCGVYDGYKITLICRERDVQSLFYPPVKATEKRYPQVAEYLMRVNYRFRIGKMTMDYHDGEIRLEVVKTGADLQADSDDAMDDLIGFPGFVMDKFMPGLAAVVMGFKSPERAFEDCDRDPEPESDTPPPASATPSPPPPPPPAEATGGQGPKAGGKTPVKKPPKRGKKVTEGKKPDLDATPPATDATPPATDALLPSGYSLKGLNIEGKIPLEKIVAAVKKFREGSHADVDAPRLNILLSGAPGSGKTAFARYLSAQVGAPLRVVQASELLSRYVGETEQNLATVFKEAKASGAILFLDEIDSFLQDRARSNQTWEVTQVNELLQQMEGFSGVMIGATNFAENLDKAVLRRFTYKLKLDYLTDEGKDIFFQRYFKTPLTADERERLCTISHLTPGDFRTVREELFYLSDSQTNAERLNALEAESVAKGLQNTRIGF